MPMESASALLQLVRDAAAGAQSANLSESDLVQRLESVRKQLHSSGGAGIAPEARAVVVCHASSQVVAFLLQHRPLTAQPAGSKWPKRVFLLETAVASSLAIVGGSGAQEDDEKGDFCNVYQKLLQKLWESAKSPQWAVNTVHVLVHLCQVLTCCWLLYDRVGKLKKVAELLAVCSDFCLEHRETKRLAKGPLLLRGMVEIVEKKECMKAVQCFRAVESCAGDGDGVFHYWYAVAMIRSGHSDDGVAALDKCIQANYEPVACLSLQALVEMQAQDFHAAAEKLQRAVEIDASQSRSLFNYAMLMEHMANFEGQQQLLEFVLESQADDRDTDKKRKLPGDNSDGFSNTVEASTCLFDKTSLSLLFPSQTASVSLSKVHLHLARAAMENGCWLESKKHFEKFLTLEDQCISSAVLAETAQDYVYVLLQCKLPTLALSKCEQFLQKFEESIGAKEVSAVVSQLRLHLYKADALLCLEHVDKCYQHLKQTVQPKMQDMMRLLNTSSDTVPTSGIFEELMICHTQLLNNLAVATACQDGNDTAVSILREGLQHYPGCLALQFNLVLLLWRKGEEATACSVWFKARGWNSLDESPVVNPVQDGNGSEEEVRIKEEPHLVEKPMLGGATVPLRAVPSTFQTAISSSSQNSTISEHVQDNLDGEGGVSAQQLSYLDALVLNYWRKNRNVKLVENAHQGFQDIIFALARGDTFAIYIGSWKTMPTKTSRLTRRSKKKTPANALLEVLTPLQKWWKAVGRLAQVQLCCSLLMQLSYVAFPAYNFSLALWCLLACTPSWSAKYTRLVPLHMMAISFSVVTDIVWMSLWVSGRVFFDQFCNTNAVSIVSCGGASDHFPGCSTNQFALFMLILNLLAKLATVGSMQRIHAITVSNRTKHRNHVAVAGSETSSAGGAEVNPLPEDIQDAIVTHERSRSNGSSRT